MKKVGLIVVALLIAGAAYWNYGRSSSAGGTSYRFATVERGDLESVVSSTGSLGAVKTVQVGTQVSGIVDKIFVDFNDKVRRGQLIALIDTTLLVSAVKDAEANLERNLAQQSQAEREFDRVSGLFEKKFVAETEFNDAKYSLDIAKASVKSAEISLERAKQNLGFSRIYAPMSGTVVERNVEVGQTVAASFSAPQLFLIANDLAKMQILASVDESDIGQIQEGQTVRFLVQAYPDDEFVGVVRQVRLQSASQENVVNYTVVVDVDNTDGRLLPGMTATVDFLIETETDVLKIANSALRFQPTEAMVNEFRAAMEARRNALPDSVRQQRQAGQGGQGQGGGGGASAGRQGGSGPAGWGSGRTGGRGSDMSMLWYLDEEGAISVARVRTGITDGQFTQITGRQIEEGMDIITGVSSTGSTGSTANPFQQQQSGRRRPGGF